MRIIMTDGPDCESTGSLMEKQYNITCGETDHPRRSEVDPDPRLVQGGVIEGIDPALAAALVWSIDQLLEH